MKSPLRLMRQGSRIGKRQKRDEKPAKDGNRLPRSECDEGPPRRTLKTRVGMLARIHNVYSELTTLHNCDKGQGSKRTPPCTDLDCHRA